MNGSLWKTVWRGAAAMGAALALAGCASVIGLDDDSSKQAPAPDYRVGDRWVYHIEDGYRLPVVWDETHEITRIGPEGITVSITRKGEHIDEASTELWLKPGMVMQGAVMSGETRTFKTPFERWRFPMRPGDRWSQWLDADTGTGRTGQINVATQVLGWEKIQTAVGEVDALRFDELTMMDDEDPWRYATHGRYLFWYAPAVNNIVRAEKTASYREKGDVESIIDIPAQREIVELRSYTRGPERGR